MEQDQALSDAALLKLLDSQEDVSWLTPEEKSRMVRLAGPPPAASHEPDASPKQTAEGAWKASTLGVPHPEVGPNVTGRDLAEAAPMIGGAIGAPLAGIPGAAVGGQIGSLVRDLLRANRGDPNTPTSFGEAVTNEGLNAAGQAALEGGGQIVAGGLRKLGGALYRTAIPKMIQDKFAQANLAESGLGSRTLLGTKQGVETAGKAKTLAAHGITDAADTVPTLTAQDIQAAFKPKYNKALIGGKTDKAVEIGDHVAKAMQEIGPEGFNGARQIARKEFLEQEGKAAMGAANPNMAAVNPQLANLERKAVVSNLRRSGPMAKALNTSQASIGVERAAQATQNSTLLNRLSHGGMFNALKSPAGFSGAGIAANELSRVPSAQVLRAIALMKLLQQEQPQE